jgi:branched-chain amino acid transport system permease protein
MSGALRTLALLVLASAAMVWWARRDATRRLTTSYASDLRTLRSNWSKLGVALGLLLYVSAPIGFSWIGFKGVHLPGALVPGLPLTNLAMSLLNFAGVFAIGTLALNLLTGFAGQVSLGHATFIGAGAYAAGYFGQDLVVGGHHLPFLVWLALAGVVGAVIATAVGPFALRLRGDYLAVITVGMLVFAEHVFNAWADITGGTPGRSNLPQPTLAVWPGKTIVFSVPGGTDADLFGFTYTRDQAFFWLIWAFVAVAVIVARNVTRTRTGRAMMAVRDRDLSAEAIGVNIAATKIKAFALCGAMAGVAGALYGSLIQSVTPEFFDLKLSIQYVAMMVVGGSGTILGSVLGAVSIIGLERLTDRFKWIFTLPGVRHVLFFVSTSSNERPTTSGLRGFIDRMQIELPNFVRLLYGLLIVVALRFFPNGIAALWDRTKRFVRRWPFAL